MARAKKKPNYNPIDIGVRPHEIPIKRIKKN